MCSVLPTRELLMCRKMPQLSPANQLLTGSPREGLQRLLFCKAKKFERKTRPGKALLAGARPKKTLLYTDNLQKKNGISFYWKHRF
jgi:hypothetical protein